MTKHLITLTKLGFSCSCGEQYDASERSLTRRPNSPVATAAQHQLAALVQESMNGRQSLVTTCLGCNAESTIPAAGDETLLMYARWVRTPCPACGKTPTDVAHAIDR